METLNLRKIKLGKHKISVFSVTAEPNVFKFCTFNVYTKLHEILQKKNGIGWTNFLKVAMVTKKGGIFVKI